jgi:hypothetical protein
VNNKNITLNINPETVCFIINKVQEFQAKEGVTFPEKMPDSENEYDYLQILADHKDDLSFQEVKSVIADLETDQKIDLLALMYVGREDFELKNWSEAQKEAKNNLKENLAEYLFAKPQLSAYLENALELLGLSCN